MSTSKQSSYLTKQEKIEGELISGKGGGGSLIRCVILVGIYAGGGA